MQMKNAISALNVHKSPKCPRLTGNLGRGTWWWHQIFDWSKNMAVLRMRNVKHAIWPLFVTESPKFPRLIRNRGRRTWWWRQIFDGKSWTCELGYGADTITMFHRRYFLWHMKLAYWPSTRQCRISAELRPCCRRNVHCKITDKHELLVITHCITQSLSQTSSIQHRN